MFNENIYGQCASVITSTGGHQIEFDIDIFLQRILLFEKYTLSSIRLKEIPFLAKYLGIKGLHNLLESNAIEIHCQPLSIGQVGQTTAIKSIAEKGVLPLFSYSFRTVEMAYYENYLEDCLKEVKKIPNITNKELKSLNRLIKGKLVYLNEDTKNQIYKSFCDDLKNDKLILNLIQSTLIPEKEKAKINLEIIKINEDDWRVETNLCSLLHISELDGHKMIELTLLKFGGLEKRIYQMHDFNSISGFKDEVEFEIFKEKLRPIGEKLCEEKLNKNFTKIIDIEGLPNFNEIIQKDNFSIEKLLKLKNTDECKEFRNWLWKMENSSEKEIKDRILNLNSKIGNFLSTKTGKTIRFMTTTIAGLINPLGITLAPIDTFLVDKFFKKDGVTAFINKLYPSLYE